MLDRRRILVAEEYGGGLPIEYQEIEYIEATGTQYIDTQYTINTRDISVEFTTQIRIKGHEYCVVGTNPTGLEIGYSQTNNRVFVWVTGHPTLAINNIETQNKLNFIYSTSGMNRMFSAENETISDTNNTDYMVGRRFILFDYANGIYRYKGKIYYCKIKDNNVLVRNMIPCYRKLDDEIGMYDTVNGVFYTNKGTGKFMKGGNV